MKKFTVYFNNEVIKEGFNTLQEALNYIEILNNTVIKTTGDYPKHGRFHI